MRDAATPWRTETLSHLHLDIRFFDHLAEFGDVGPDALVEFLGRACHDFHAGIQESLLDFRCIKRPRRFLMQPVDDSLRCRCWREQPGDPFEFDQTGILDVIVWKIFIPFVTRLF